MPSNIREFGHFTTAFLRQGFLEHTTKAHVHSKEILVQYLKDFFPDVFQLASIEAVNDRTLCLGPNRTFAWTLSRSEGVI